MRVLFYIGATLACAACTKHLDVECEEDLQLQFGRWRRLQTRRQAAVAMHTAKWHTDPIECVAQTPDEIAYAGVTI